MGALRISSERAGGAPGTKAPPVLALALVALGLAACGEARKGAGSGAPTAAGVAAASPASGASGVPGRLRGDEDEDGAVAVAKERNRPDTDGDSDNDGGGYYDADDEHFLDYGHAASVADGRAIAAAVRRYYAAAARDDGAAACRLVSSAVARAVIGEYGHALGLRVARRQSCAPVMAKLLGRLHPQMSTENATLRLGVIRVEGDSGRVLLSFDTSWPMCYTQVRREHGAWKIDALLDFGVP